MHQNRLNFVGVQAFLEIDDMANNDNGQDTYIFHAIHLISYLEVDLIVYVIVSKNTLSVSCIFA